MSQDERKTQRHRTLKGGKIVFNDRRSVYDCTVRNLSETGAKLAVTSTLGIPQRFALTLADGRNFDCEIAWHTETEIGVRFL
ncbi:PilZ domain-containing protein [Devosia sp. XK-2]|uniref:PilZ domain-containing protein n=1 Tax=Devosia sp. XK-2 TaxID=3126689 RepID=UPI0030CB2EE3